MAARAGPAALLVQGRRRRPGHRADGRGRGAAPAPGRRRSCSGALALLAESFGRDVWWLWRTRTVGGAPPRGGGAHAARRSAWSGPRSCCPPTPPTSSGCRSRAWLLRRRPLLPLPPGPGAAAAGARAGSAVLVVLSRSLDIGFRRRPRPAVRPLGRLGLPRPRGRRARRLDRRRRGPRDRRSLAVALVLVVLVLLPLAPVRAAGPSPGTAAPPPWPAAPSCSPGAARPVGVDQRGRARLRRGRPGARRPRRPADVRARDRRRPATPTPRRPAAPRTARQGRARRVRRDLRTGRRPGHPVLARRRRGPRRGHPAAAGGRLRSPQRLPHLADVRRRQLAGALDPPVGAVGRQPAPLRPAAGRRPADADPAFGGAGWRTVSTSPPTRRTGRRASASTASTSCYDSRNVGYQGPQFGYAPMPDQYTLSSVPAARARPRRPAAGDGRDRPRLQPPPVGAAPRCWCRGTQVGDGSVFDAAAPTQRATIAGRRRRSTASRSSTRWTPWSPCSSSTPTPTWCSWCSATTSRTPTSPARPRPRRTHLRDRPRPGRPATGSPAGAGSPGSTPRRTRRSGGWTPFRDRFLDGLQLAEARRSCRTGRRRGPAPRPRDVLGVEGGRAVRCMVLPGSACQVATCSTSPSRGAHHQGVVAVVVLAAARSRRSRRSGRCGCPTRPG